MYSLGLQMKLIASYVEHHYFKSIEIRLFSFSPHVSNMYLKTLRHTSRDKVACPSSDPLDAIIPFQPDAFSFFREQVFGR